MPYYPPASSGSFLPLAGGTMTGTITSTLGTITDPKHFLDLSATWNDAADTFYGIKMGVTVTAAAAASRILAVQVGGVNMFSVNKDGRAFVAQDIFISPDGGGGSRSYFAPHYVGLRSDGNIGFASGTDGANGNDTAFARNAAGVVEVNNGTAGTYRDILVRSILIDGAPSTAGAGQIAIGADTRTTIGANGGASALTALPVGYIDINVAGSSYQIPYYNRGA